MEVPISRSDASQAGSVAAAPPIRSRPLPGRLGRWLWSRPWLVLLFSMLIWGGHGAAARLSAGEIAPMQMVFLRWIVVCACLLPLVGRQVAPHVATLRRSWRRVVALGLVGFALFNVLFYIAANHTSAINITLLQASVPVFVFVGAATVHRTRISAQQMIGMGVAIIGVLMVATHGDLQRVVTLSFNSGDVFMLLACMLYAGYTLGQRDRPAVPPLVYLAALAVVACAGSLPFFLVETLGGHAFWPSLKGLALLMYVALGPSLVAQLAYIRGIELIGPARAGLFNNFVPLFGALAAVLVVGEPFAWYHGVALVLVIVGVLLAELRRGR